MRIRQRQNNSLVLADDLRPMSDAGIAFLKQLEGLSLTPYRDGNGWAIGYGHFIEPGEEWMMDGITLQQAEYIFNYDLQAVSEAVNATIENYPGPEFWDALYMFAFNIGADNFKTSQLARMVNDYPGTTDEQIYNFWLTTWVGNPPKQVLLDRRKIEASYAYGGGGDMDFQFTVAKKQFSYWWLLLPIGAYIISKS